MDPIVLPALITAAVGLGLALSRKSATPTGPKASDSGPAPPLPSPTPPADARQPVDYNVTYSDPLPGSGAVSVRAVAVPGHDLQGGPGSVTWTGRLSWEAPDKSYGAVTGTTPLTGSDKQLNGLLLARRAPAAPVTFPHSGLALPPIPQSLGVRGSDVSVWHAWAIKDGGYEYMFSYSSTADLFRALDARMGLMRGRWYDFLIVKSGSGQIPNDTILNYGPYQPYASLWLYQGPEFGWAQKFDVALAEDVERYLLDIGPHYLYLQLY